MYLFNAKFNGWFCLVSCAIAKFLFWKGGCALGYTQFWFFLEIYLFSKILSLKSFGNSRGNSYVHFLVEIT